MNETMKNMLEDKKSAQIALLRAFPSKQSFRDFKEKDKTISKKAITKIVSFASSLGYLSSQSENSFLDFIETSSRAFKQSTVSVELSFEKVINEITSGGSINHLIRNLNIISEKLGMPKFNAPMFSRLKKDFKADTAKKRGLLRVIAFWIGLVHPEYEWDYQALAGIQSSKLSILPLGEKEGVRIDFTFQGRGELIDIEMINWLKTEIPLSVKDLKLYHLVGKQLVFYTTTSVTLEIPKKPGSKGEPRLYDQAVRDSLAIAHQIILRWAFSDTSERQSTISIGIAAGEFQKLSIPLQAILGASLKESSAIRLTDFVCICIRSSDIKVVIHSKPKEILMPDGSCMPIWMVKYFWPGYYDIAPCLLDDSMFPNTIDAYQNFKTNLLYPDTEISESLPHQTLRRIRRFPQKDFLGIEVAKLCLSRKMFHEANVILSNVLASDPYHLIARLYRIVVFMNLALEQPECQLFEIFFQRAQNESQLVLDHCADRDEEIFVEIGLLYFGRSAYYIELLRKKKITYPEKDNKNSIIDFIKSDIQTALNYLEKGLTYSPTGNRSIFWIGHLRCLLKMIDTEENICSTEHPILDRNDIYPDICEKLFFSLGWLDSSYFQCSDPSTQGVHLMELFQRTMQSIDSYYSSMHFRVCRPNIAYAIASVLWDFSPTLTVGVAKVTTSWLEKASSEAEGLAKQGIGVYGIKAYYMQIQPAEQFIQCINKAVKKIKSIVAEDIYQDDLYVLDKNRTNGFKLFTMHFDIEVTPGLLL